MRKLGVQAWDGIILGPEPPSTPKSSKKSRKKVDRELEERRSYYREVLGRIPSDEELRRLP